MPSMLLRGISIPASPSTTPPHTEKLSLWRFSFALKCPAVSLNSHRIHTRLTQIIWRLALDSKSLCHSNLARRRAAAIAAFV